MAIAAHRHLRIAGGQLLGHFVRRIVRAVVDDEHAEFRRQLARELEDFVNAFPQPRFTIVNGQYYRQRLVQHAMLQLRASERACLLRQLRSVVLSHRPALSPA